MSKMVGAGVLKPEFMHIDFWTRFPRKMSASKAYLKRKTSINTKTDEEKKTEEKFMLLLRENGITSRMRTAKG